MDKILGQKIHWIDKSKINSWTDLGLPVPGLFFQAGTYYISSFKKLGNEVRKNNGKVILLSDDNKKNNIRQLINSIIFNFVFYKRFSAVWVPGESGKKLMQSYGFSKKQIFKGLYGSDNNCFTLGSSIDQRAEQFIFIGQLIHRKGIDTLVEGFKTFLKSHPKWKLIIYGEGECIDLVQNCSAIIVYPFAQPPQIAQALRESRFLILPSRIDHWPLVVVEASLAGCGLILSENIGNISELLSEKNGFTFSARSGKSLSISLEKAASLSISRLKEVSKESFRLGSKFTTEEWSKNFCKIISEMTH